MESWKKYITPEDFTTPLYRQIAEMIVLQYHEGGVNPAKLLNQFVDSEEQKEVAGLFNARIPLETEEEKRRALHDVICNMKENSIAYQSAHMNVTDMAALQKLMADEKEPGAVESRGTSGFRFLRRPGYQRKTLESSVLRV